MARQGKGGLVNYHDPAVLEAELLERGLVVDRHARPRKHQEEEGGLFADGASGESKSRAGGWCALKRSGGTIDIWIWMDGQTPARTLEEVADDGGAGRV
jgi:hypothetical protein